eukprot:7433463-Karenia_brevis.AAC.1
MQPPGIGDYRGEQKNALQPLVSWVDPMDYAAQSEDLDKIPMGLDQVVKLDKVLKLYVDSEMRPKFEEALTQAG